MTRPKLVPRLQAANVTAVTFMADYKNLVTLVEPAAISLSELPESVTFYHPYPLPPHHLPNFGQQDGRNLLLPADVGVIVAAIVGGQHQVIGHG